MPARSRYSEVDDRFEFESDGFMGEEGATSSHFKTKPRVLLSTNPTNLNGVWITKRTDQTARLTKPYKIYRINSRDTQKDFTNQRILDQYIGVNTIPDAYANVQFQVVCCASGTISDSA